MVVGMDDPMAKIGEKMLRERHQKAWNEHADSIT